MNENKPDVLELLARHELAIKQLYEVFADRFADHHDFWSRIAREEQRHADQLESIRSESAHKKWLLIENRIKAEAVQSSISYVDSQKAEARAGRLALIEALSIARDLETALLEKVFYRIANFIPNEIKPILMSISADSERHRKLIAELLDFQKHQE